MQLLDVNKRIFVKLLYRLLCFVKEWLRKLKLLLGDLVGFSCLFCLMCSDITLVLHLFSRRFDLALFDFALTAEEMTQIGQLDEGRSLFGWD